MKNKQNQELNIKTENNFLPEGISLHRRLYLSKEFIDDCYSEPIDLDIIARKAYFSPYHFLRQFKKVYNVTPHRYLTEKRIDKAKELLKKTGSTVTEVCFEVGFQSLGSFSSLFNKYVGLSPTEFQKQHSRKIMFSLRFPEKLIPVCFTYYFSTAQQ
jgi:AraC-like DNA-binding protein